MRSILVFLFFFFILLETTAVGFPITVILASCLAVTTGLQYQDVLFLAGILFDLFAGLPLGQTSLFFLIIAYLASRYQRKMSAGHIVYTLVFLTIVFTGYQYIFSGTVILSRIGVSLLISAVLLWIINRIAVFTQHSSSRLSV